MSQFLAEQLEAGKIKWERALIRRYYHDPWHLGRHVGVFEDQKVIKSMAGINLWK